MWGYGPAAKPQNRPAPDGARLTCEMPVPLGSWHILGATPGRPYQFFTYKSPPNRKSDKNFASGQGAQPTFTAIELRPTPHDLPEGNSLSSFGGEGWGRRLHPCDYLI